LHCRLHRLDFSVQTNGGSSVSDTVDTNRESETDKSVAGCRPHPVALLLVDVINDFDFPEAASLISEAEKAAPRIQALAARAHLADVPVVYVNDNFGHWRSDLRAMVARCSEAHRPGARVVGHLAPQAQDLFVLKPMHSGFFHTPLELLLRELETKVIILCGFATNLCVAFTAYDAHMRGFRLVVPQDTTAANTEELCSQTLHQLKISVDADIRPSDTVDFDVLGHANTSSS
jgi:nicotinamidase-related amidase